MLYRQAFRRIDKTGLSPEKAAAELGVSGMTLRRWRVKPGDEELPDMYRRALEPMLHRLLGEGALHPEDPDVVAALAAGDEGSFQKTLLGLGITLDILKGADKKQNTVVSGLARIGENAKRQSQVRGSNKMLERFKAMSVEWKSRIDVLTRALKSDKLTALDKLVAFGALFYLITPFDLIPDAIPVFGLVDDFIILGIAVLYYRTRFPHLFGAEKNAKSGSK